MSNSLRVIAAYTLIMIAGSICACGGGGKQPADVLAPVTLATPAGGTYDAAQSVVLSCDDGNGSGCADTYFTLDGSEPTQASTVYSSPISIDTDTQLRFFSVDQAGNAEAVRSEDYVIDIQVEDSDPPTTTAAPAGGTYDAAQSVVLSCDDGNGSGCADTYFTLDGSEPTQASTVYSSPISIDTDTQLRFFSVDQAGNAEAVRSETYQIHINTPPVAYAGPDQEVTAGTLVQLDGTGSSDADLDSLTYAWSMPTVPSGSTAALDDPSSAQPSFTADLPGEYHLLLTVDDGQAVSDPDGVVITAIDRPQATVFPPSGSPLGRTQMLVVTFDQSMDPATLSTGGDIGALSASWSTGAVADDTLTLTAQTSWDPGWLHILTLDVDSADGFGLGGLTLFYDVLTPEELTYYYVDGQWGDDSNDGLSPQAPKQTLRIMVEEAVAPAAVLVAEGDHLVNGDPGAGSRIVLREGVSLYGGYASAWPDDFASRDILAHPTRIIDQGDTPGVNNVPVVALDGSGITPDTVVNGFSIVAGGGTFCAAVRMDNASPTLRYNGINGGSCDYSYGAWLTNGSAAQIQDNSIDGGVGVQQAVAVYSENSQGIIERNLIDGGDGGSWSAGVYSYESNGDVVRNNFISGGLDATTTTGVSLDGGTVEVANNTIDGGLNPLYATAVYYISGQARIVNNILYNSGGDYRLCIWEGGGGVENPDSVYNNDMFDCPDALYVDFTTSGGDCPFWGNGNCLMDPAEVNALGDLGTGASGNVGLDPGFADPAGGDLRLTPASPVEVRQGGLDLSAEFGNDAWSHPRTVPWSIGAHEQD